MSRAYFLEQLYHAHVPMEPHLPLLNPLSKTIKKPDTDSDSPGIQTKKHYVQSQSPHHLQAKPQTSSQQEKKVFGF